MATNTRRAKSQAESTPASGASRNGTAGPLSVVKLVNGSAGDPCLYLDFPGQSNAVLFDCGDLAPLTDNELRDVAVLCFSHFHLDHFCGFDRLLRLNLDADKSIRVIGPPSTQQRLSARLSAYQFLGFSFQKLAFEVHEVHPNGRITAGRMACLNGWRVEPLPTRALRAGGLVYDSPECRIRVGLGSHTVPVSLLYALETKRAHRFDREKAAAGVLKPGRWIGRVHEALKLPKSQRPQQVTVDNGTWPFETLVRDYFTLEPPQRYAFFTDTRKTDESWAAMLRLARGAARLYCDAYYLHEHADKAAQHGHLTARQAAELAVAAEARELWLMHAGPRYRGRYEALAQEARQVFASVYAHWPQR